MGVDRRSESVVRGLWKQFLGWDQRLIVLKRCSMSTTKGVSQRPIKLASLATSSGSIIADQWKHRWVFDPYLGILLLVWAALATGVWRPVNSNSSGRGASQLAIDAITRRINQAWVLICSRRVILDVLFVKKLGAIVWHRIVSLIFFLRHAAQRLESSLLCFVILHCILGGVPKHGLDLRWPEIKHHFEPVCTLGILRMHSQGGSTIHQREGRRIHNCTALNRLPIAALVGHWIYNKLTADCYICRVPTVQMLPYRVRHNLVIKVLYKSRFDLIAIARLVFL